MAHLRTKQHDELHHRGARLHTHQTWKRKQKPHEHANPHINFTATVFYTERFTSDSATQLSEVTFPDRNQ